MAYAQLASITISALMSMKTGRFMAKHFLSILPLRFGKAQSPEVAMKPKSASALFTSSKSKLSKAGKSHHGIGIISGERSLIGTSL